MTDIAAFQGIELRIKREGGVEGDNGRSLPQFGVDGSLGRGLGALRSLGIGPLSASPRPAALLLTSHPRYWFYFAMLCHFQMAPSLAPPCLLSLTAWSGVMSTAAESYLSLTAR